MLDLSKLFMCNRSSYNYALSPFWFGITTFSEAILLLLIYPSVLFLISGVFNYFGQMIKSLAFKYEEASVIVPFQYFEVLFLFLSDLIIFQYTFSITDILGALMITFSLLTPIGYKAYVGYMQGMK
mmetsp:Transcript_2988/g.2468  ORF Transcript_2988/g.2468 Transcript_2988/m.2468 type:complete len:126 (+) Transcript_2988:621-998(+)